MDKRSLLWRVTWLAVIVAGGASSSVAIFSSILSDRWLLRNEDQHLSELAHSLSIEVPLEGLDEWIDEERREAKPAGLELGLFRSNAPIARTSLPSPRLGHGCETIAMWRICTFETPGLTLAIGKPVETMTTHRRPFMIASAIAVCLTMIAAAFVSRRIAKWAVRFDEEMAHARRFAANAAHEMRTPLATMSAELELLGESETLAGPDEQAVRKVRLTLRRLKGLVERLLILSVEPSPPPTMREVVSMTELADDVLGDLPPELRARVTLRCENDLLTTTGDFHLLKALASNAIENGLKFSGDKPVTVSIEDEAKTIRLLVQDQGPGIAAEERERVFEAFFRSPSARASDVAGYGVGLALIAHISRLHGGGAKFLPVASGATLEITLPKPKV